MRLYLSSFRLGSDPELLADLVTGERQGWIIANAVDGMDEVRRRHGVARDAADLDAIGLRGRELDLREFVPSTISDAFGRPDFVWVRGGNVFVLRAALARSGADALIVSALRNDLFVYSGYSAGACVLAPSLAGLELCDPIEQSIEVYGVVRSDGLGVLDRPVVPHLSSPEHPETAVLGEVASRYEAAGQPYWGLRDGQALVGDASTLVLR